MYEVHLQYGYTLKDIAEYIGVHYSIESRVIKKTRGKMKSDIARPDHIIYVHEASFFDKKSKSGSEWVFIFLIIVFCHFNGNE